jgi:hypothetical protein
LIALLGPQAKNAFGLAHWRDHPKSSAPVQERQLIVGSDCAKVFAFERLNALLREEGEQSRGVNH